MGRKPKADTYDWTSEKEEQLIQWWEETEYLYNLQCRDYKDTAKKERAIESIAAKIGTTAKVITDRMTTLRNMLGAVRRKETKAKSGSAPYHPTQRDRIIKAKLGFLERDIRTRKTVSTLPNLTESQATEGDMSMDDGSMSQNAVDVDLMRQFLTPGAEDAFMGVDMDIDEFANTEEVVQDNGIFPIPRELLVTLPIAEVGPNTKIIHVNHPDQGGQVDVNVEANETQAPAPTPGQAPRANTPAPRPGTSGVALRHIEGNLMDVQEGGALTKNPHQHQEIVNRQREDSRAAQNKQDQPKKGYNTKNRKQKAPTPDDTQDVDPTLKERMTVLGEITELLKNSYGARRNEMHVWGSYIGLKADRLPAGKARDKLLVHVEQLMNEALYEGEGSEE